jgi:hypothetical protein
MLKSNISAYFISIVIILLSNISALKEALEHLIKNRDKYFTLCETYRATLTPR